MFQASRPGWSLWLSILCALRATAIRLTRMAALVYAPDWPIVGIGRSDPGGSSLIRNSVGKDRDFLLDGLGQVLQGIHAIQTLDGLWLFLFSGKEVMLESLVDPLYELTASYDTAVDEIPGSVPELIELIELKVSSSLFVSTSNVSLFVEKLAIVAQTFRDVLLTEFGQSKIKRKEAAFVVSLDMIPDGRPSVFLWFLDDLCPHRVQIDIGQTVDQRITVTRPPAEDRNSDLEHAKQRVNTRLDEAKKQLQDIEESNQVGTPISVCYVAPWPKAETPTAGVPNYFKLLKDLTSSFHAEGCAVALFIPDGEPLVEKGRAYPGVALIARVEEAWPNKD